MKASYLATTLWDFFIRGEFKDLFRNHFATTRRPALTSMSQWVINPNHMTSLTHLLHALTVVCGLVYRQQLYVTVWLWLLTVYIIRMQQLIHTQIHNLIISLSLSLSLSLELYTIHLLTRKFKAYSHTQLYTMWAGCEIFTRTLQVLHASLKLMPHRSN